MLSRLLVQYDFAMNFVIVATLCRDFCRDFLLSICICNVCMYICHFTRLVKIIVDWVIKCFSHMISKHPGLSISPFSILSAIF